MGGAGWRIQDGQVRVTNRKGCDCGYALAVDSCEGVAGVDACTVAAFEAITAFAVPNLGGHLAVPSIFSGLAVLQVALRTYRSVYFGWATDYGSPLFSTVDCGAATLVMRQPVTPARELPAWTQVPSQPLMRSPLSQFQTSADISQRRRFFRVWRFCESPRSPITRPTSSRLPWGPLFSAVDRAILAEDVEMSTPKVCALNG